MFELMLALALALTASVAWGGASVFGGQAARTNSAFTVAWWFSFMALPGMLALAFIASGTEAFSIDSLLIGLVAGAAAVTGATFLFFGFAKAPASSVVPTSGLMSALLPVAAANVRGEHLSSLAFVGVGLAVGAIWLVASDGHRMDLTGIWYGLGSGTSFGVQFAILGFVSERSGLWPIVGVFVGASMVGTLVVIAKRSPLRLRGTAFWLTAGGSACSVVANTSYLYATRLGSLSLAAILAALYAIPAVILAAVFLKEAMLPRHWLGLGIAGLATAFISV
ncbi:MAG: DMT family transporter [Acidimicrobiia bacterium]|nr:DMT family transporter [Acidimicrobiia bacterium]